MCSSDLIAAGDVYQVNLAQRFHAPFHGSSLALYRRLRARNPAPFGAYLDFAGTGLPRLSPGRVLPLEAPSRVAAAGAVEAQRLGVATLSLSEAGREP